MKVINIMIEKGGDGKTTTSGNLAVGLAQRGLRVGLGELDPQGNLTKHILKTNDSIPLETFKNMRKQFDESNLKNDNELANALEIIKTYTCEKSFEYDMASVLEDPQTIHKALLDTPYQNLKIIPGNHELSETDMKLKTSMFNATGRLYKALDIVKDDFDVFILDNPPFSNALTYNSIHACAKSGDTITLPFKVDPGSFEGLYKTIHDLIELLEYEPNLAYDFKILPVMVERNKWHREAIETLKYLFKDRVYDTSIRFQGKPVVEASMNKEVLVIKNNSGVANDYNAFVDEVYKEIMEEKARG